jgi:hypothetical protein
VNLFLLTHWLAACYPELEFNDNFFETGDGGGRMTTGTSKTSKNKNKNKNKDRQNRAKFIPTHNDHSLKPLSASEVGEIVKKTVENNFPVETPEHVRQTVFLRHNNFE